MLKKSLIALAISSVSMVATAATVSTPEALISNQGAVSTASSNIDGTVGALAGAVNVVLNAEYKVDDIITLTFTGGAIDLANSTPATSVDLVSVAANQAPSSMTLGLLSSTATTLTYRVTELTLTATDISVAPATTIGGEIDFSGLKFTNESILGSGAVSVAYAAETSSGIPLDVEKTNSAALFSTMDQFTASVTTELDAVIDVNKKRLSFYVDATTNTTVDTLAFVHKDQEGADDGDGGTYAFAQGATATASKYVLAGDFGFLGEADETTGVITTTNVTATDGTHDADVTVYADRVEVESTGTTAEAGTKVGPLEALTVSIDVAGDVATEADEAIQTQTFKMTSELTYDDSASTEKSLALLVGADAGSWTLNGAVVHVPFMPFRDGYSPIVNVSNTSTQDGDIEVLVYAADNAWVAPKSYTLTKAAKAQSQTNITSALRDAGIEGDVAFDIIVNAPKENIEVSALYYNLGDRAVMNTTKK